MHSCSSKIKWQIQYHHSSGYQCETYQTKNSQSGNQASTSLVVVTWVVEQEAMGLITISYVDKLVEQNRVLRKFRVGEKDHILKSKETIQERKS